MAIGIPETFGIGEHKVVGHRPARIDGIEKVTGRAIYPEDNYHLPNTLHAKTVMSPYPKCTVVSIDASAAEALPGVKLVMTPFNYPEVFLQNQGREVFYAGEEVAAVVAVDEETCEIARNLIKVEYQRKTGAVYNILDALKPDAAIVYESRGAKSNNEVQATPFWSELTPPTAKNPQGVWAKRVMGPVGGFGDTEQGFKECDVIVDVDGLQYPHTKVPNMAGRFILADYKDDPVNTTLDLYVRTKGLYTDRQPYAAFMKMPINKIRMICKWAQGMWGTGGWINNDTDERGARVACFASRTLKKPVRLYYTQHQDNVYGWGKHCLGHVKLGFKSDGTLHAMEHTQYAEGGTAGNGSVTSSARAGGLLLYNRNCKHMKLVLGTVRTNRLKMYDFCGIGTASPTYVVESGMDIAAEKLGMDPIELRKKNHFVKGGFDAHAGYTLAYNSNDGHSEALDACAKEMNWAASWGGWKAPSTKTGVIRHGIGVAIKTHTGGAWEGSSMLTKLFPDGSVQLSSAMGDAGMEQQTATCQMTAEVLGMSYNKITIVRGSSDLPHCVLLGGSNGTWNTGWPAWGAANDVRNQVLAAGSFLFNNAKVEDLDMGNDGVWLKADPTKKKTFRDVFNVLGTPNTDPSRNKGNCYEIVGYSYRRSTDGLIIPREKSATIASLDVDTETGEVFNVKLASANAIGKAINHFGLENMSHMGVIHGAMAMDMDNYTDPGTGKNLSYNWIYQCHPVMEDIESVALIVEKPGDESHPYGATAASEGQPNAHLAAVANAIYNAIGVRMKVAPYGPDKILAALGKL